MRINSKLGTHVALGLGSVVAISLVSEGVGLWEVLRVRTPSSLLEQEYMPEWAIAGHLERHSLMALHAIREYGLSEDESFLQSGQSSLADTLKSLEEAQRLADHSPHLTGLRAKLGVVRDDLNEYQRHLEQAVQLTRSRAEHRRQLDQAADACFASCNDLLRFEARAVEQATHAADGPDAHAMAAGGHGEPPADHPPASGSASVGAAACPEGDAILEQLKQGNRRFVEEHSARSHLDQVRRAETAAHGQHPQVTVLACSDSRVPVEVIFDQGVGDVFPVRVAGNVCGTDELGTIEYGVDHLETPLLLVMGHTRCGAVTAAATGAQVHGSIPALVENIAPAVARVRHEHAELQGDGLVGACVVENTWRAIEVILTRSADVQARAKTGKVSVVAAIYHIEDGTIEWLGAHPRQAELLAVPINQHGHAGLSDKAGLVRQVEHLHEMAIIQDVIELAHAARVALRPAGMPPEAGLLDAPGKHLDQMMEQFKALRGMAVDPEDTARIDAAARATELYQTAMQEYSKDCAAVEAAGRRSVEVGDRVLADAHATAMAGLDHARVTVGQATRSLSTGAVAMAAGLVVSLLAGAGLALMTSRALHADSPGAAS